MIWESVSSLQLQVGRTTSTMGYTPSLSIFSFFLRHRHPPPPPLLPPLPLSLQPPRPASECTGESRQLRTAESEVGVDHRRACLEVCVFCEREEEQEGESIATILSLSHTYSHSLHGTIFTSFPNARFCGSLSQ